MRLDGYDNDYVNAVIEKRKRVRELAKFETSKRRLFLLGLFISILLIIGVYFLNSRSNINKIIINGNHYLDDEYVLDLANITQNDKYLLVMNFIVERNIKNEPLIKNVKVTHGPNNLIKIDVEEKQPVAYRFIKELELILDDGSIIKGNDEYTSLIARLPLINGFNDDMLIKDVAKALGEIDQYIIESISEINKYSESYDLNMLQILMRDGNYVFVSFYSTEVLNNYFYISNQIPTKKNCIYIEDISKNAYSSACPWAPAEEKIDENAEDIENKDENFNIN